MHVELLAKARISLTHLIDSVALDTARCIHRLNSEDLVAGTAWRAASLVQSIVNLPPLVFSFRSQIAFQVVRIDVFAMQKAKNAVKYFLSASHITLLAVLASTHTVHI